MRYERKKKGIAKIIVTQFDYRKSKTSIKQNFCGKYLVCVRFGHKKTGVGWPGARFRGDENLYALLYFAVRLLSWLAVGKSLGIGCVTLPVAAHSAPRQSVVMNPAHSIE